MWVSHTSKPFWALFWRLKKVPRRKGETASRRYRSNGYTPTPPTTWSAQRPPLQKKRATEVAQNALRAHYTQKDLRLTLMRILPDKKSKPCKKQNHEANRQHSGDHHVIEKHDAPPAPALLR